MDTVTILGSAAVGAIAAITASFCYRLFARGIQVPEAETTLSPDLPCAPLSSQVTFWDPHAALNALNRAAIQQGNGPTYDGPLFAVAEHMKFLALFIKTDGWANVQQTQEWLEAWLHLHQLLHPGRSEPRLHLNLPRSATKIDIRPIGQGMLAHLRDAGPIHSLHLEFSPINQTPSSHSRGAEQMQHYWLECVMERSQDVQAGYTVVGDVPERQLKFSATCLALAS